MARKESEKRYAEKASACVFCNIRVHVSFQCCVRFRSPTMINSVNSIRCFIYKDISGSANPSRCYPELVLGFSSWKVLQNAEGCRNGCSKWELVVRQPDTAKLTVASNVFSISVETREKGFPPIWKRLQLNHSESLGTYSTSLRSTSSPPKLLDQKCI